MRHIHDWERCINCKVNGSGGKIAHLKTCPDYRKPNLVTAKNVRLGDLIRR